MRYVAVADPAFAAKHCPQGLTPHNFNSFPFIAFNRKDDLQSEFVASVCGLKHVALSQMYVPSSEGQVRAVLAGWGISVLPELKVRDYLKTGQLIELMPGRSLSVALYWHCWNLDSALLDALTKALKSAAATALVDVPGV